MFSEDHVYFDHDMLTYVIYYDYESVDNIVKK